MKRTSHRDRRGPVDRPAKAASIILATGSTGIVFGVIATLEKTLGAFPPALVARGKAKALEGGPLKQEDEKRQSESRRILDEVEREGDVFSSLTARSLGRARKHFSAGDADDQDWVEVWGTRIGRALALVAFVVLVVWLISHLANR